MLEPLLPVAVLGRPPLSRRRLIDGIRWRVRTGAPWRDLPSEYGPWQTVYGLFRQYAAGARRGGQAQKEPPGGTRTEPEDHGLGRSRGGFTTKIHLACE